MKKEQLLEAIGGVSEDMLLESEQRTRRSGKTVRRIVLVAAIVAALAVTAVASTGILTGILKAEENGTSASNLATGMGNFVYSDGYIYRGVPGYIYKCDPDGNIVKAYPLSDQLETPHHMFATADAIVYVNSMGLPVEPEDETAPNRESHWGLRVQLKDGSEPYSICPDVEATHAYADGDQLYINNGGTMLSRVDLVTMEQTDLLENVYSYFVDDTYIYAIQNNYGNNGDANCYFRSAKDVIAFEKIPLPFDPNNIVADGEDLYICEWMNQDDQKATGERYRVNRVHDGEVTPLPVYSWFYQVLDGCVLYIDRADTYPLKCYDLATGETTTLAENVFEFSVLEDRYICIVTFNEDPRIYDWQTGECVPLETNQAPSKT